MLANELIRATVLTPRDIPASVATMHSRLEFRDDVTWDVRCATLVYPDEDDGEAGSGLGAVAGRRGADRPWRGAVDHVANPKGMAKPDAPARPLSATWTLRRTMEGTVMKPCQQHRQSRPGWQLMDGGLK